MFRDPVLNQLHESVRKFSGGLEPLVSQPPERYFGELAESILSQQLSTKVADVIIQRVKTTVGGAWEIEAVLDVPHEELRSAGVSNAKARYLKHVAEAWQSGLVVPAKLTKLSDAEVISTLVQIKGVGRWTAEMFLIFNLGRPDVFSAGDYGLKKAISLAYGLPIETPTLKLLELAEQWQPQRSLASRILWKSLELPPTKNPA